MARVAAQARKRLSLKPMKTDESRSRMELSREKIIGAALELIDRDGLAALNMRHLADALGAGTMSLYRYFPSKSELIDAVVDDVVAGFAPAAAGGGWPEEARAMCLRVRAGMMAHPELAELIGRQFPRSPTSLRVNTAMIARLRAIGVPPDLLSETYWALSAYTSGYTLLEAQALRRRAPHPRRSSPAERVRKLAALLEIADGISPEEAGDAAVVLARPLDDPQFLFGLDCVIAGLGVRFKAHKTS